MNDALPLVLIAEDDKALTMAHRLMLEDEEIELQIVNNGEEAIAAINARQPSLLLLDILMPKRNGFDVLKHIRQKKYDFPVIVLTNLSSEDDKQACMRLGAKDCFVKSETDTNQLRRLIVQYLEEA